MGKKSPTTSESGDTFSGFSSLLSRKKVAPTGTQIGQNTVPVELGGEDTNSSGNNSGLTNPIIPGQNNPNGIPINQNELGSTYPSSSPGGFTPLPDPSNPGGIVPPDPVTPKNTDVIIDQPVTPTGKDNPCDTTKLPKNVASALCRQGDITRDEVVAVFSLNDAEQAELDRLNRMFARLAPYLKTESDVLTEQSNQEAHEDFTINANRMARETDAERLGIYYTGPYEIVRPFLKPTEFGNDVIDDITTEIIGKNNFEFNLLKLAGLNVDALGNIKNSVDSGIDNAKQGVGKVLEKIGIKNDKVNNFLEKDTEAPSIPSEIIKNTVWPRIQDAIENFTQKKISDKLGGKDCQLKKESKSIATNDECGFSLFEETLKIY